MDQYQRDNFPTRTEVIKVLKDYNFNLILDVVKASECQSAQYMLYTKHI